MKLLRFFDKLEDKIRSTLSHWPIAYAFLGGIGVVLFWRGVWHTADTVSVLLLDGEHRLSFFQILDGPLSLLVSIVLLLMTGLFVSYFIGNEVMISGLRGEKKLDEKTEAEVRIETGEIAEMHNEIHKIESEIEAMGKKMKGQ